MFAVRRLAARSTLSLVQRRSAQTLPRAGSEESMVKDATQHLRERLAYQKELAAANPGHSHEEEVDEMWKWIKISFIIAIPVCVLACAKDYFFEEHHHDDGKAKPDYMKVRKKEFPWDCEDCALFDQPCWDKCKAEKAAEAA
mmetsp:Transcript_20134/g.22990  ORF Transcript_20134/g.22990 Transcript_20134/m.22990 type:complete len:142 (-) Transcript_20134:327-752(-)|eukprot:CAMPEP_0194168690 /NCGR_PEP_ID=MMETSP0154-20130528/3558_1 /TAXON_ID=1049557 /ORGANISM="Thalassiothrix antarctica, Strain L6-D1" /LENGTH=141 /DNA_ID=CAMNT_0038879877 /DNA_START=51 /DNA_END=476 /DNA_ORIENTATION=+